MIGRRQAVKALAGSAARFERRQRHARTYCLSSPTITVRRIWGYMDPIGFPRRIWTGSDERGWCSNARSRQRRSAYPRARRC
jgi:hypothetical protein